MYQERSVQINTLQVLTEGEPKPNLRQSIANLLEGVDWQPASMSPSSILLIRRLADPLPGQILKNPNTFRAPPQWEGALRSNINDLYRQAVRPKNGFLPADAKVILFRDQAEMLACLAFDICQERIFNKWWWKTILRYQTISLSENPNQSLKILLKQNLKIFPAIITLLYNWNREVAVLNRLSPEEIKIILRALSQEYHFSTFYDLIFSKTWEKPKQIKTPILETRQEKNQDLQSATSEILQKQSNLRKDINYIWVKYQISTKESHPLSIIQLLLQNISLILYQRPQMMHSIKFQYDIKKWWQNIIQRIPNDHNHPSTTIKVNPQSKNNKNWGDKSLTIRGKRIHPPLNSQDEFTDSHQKKEYFLQNSHNESTDPHQRKEYYPQEKDTYHPPPYPEILKTPQITFKKTDKPQLITETLKEKIKKPNQEINLDLKPKHTEWIFGEEGINTKVGGVFFLINLMVQLNLPWAFDDQYQISGKIGAWETLDLLGRGFLTKSSGSMDSDPIWPILAHLAGREPDIAPGKDLILPKNIHIPEDWLPQLGIIKMSFKNLSSNPITKNLNPSSKRWLVLMIPYLYSYLSTQLNLTKKDLFKNLFFLPARIYTTATHVDVVFNLEDISMPVRLAGLDIDPGWQADFARVIQFYFK